MDDAQDVLEQAREWCALDHRVALATVVRTWRSSPRPTGSLLAVDDTGRFVGSVSGGCVESAVVERALEIVQTGAAERLHFGVTNELAWEVGLPCGGEIDVLVHRIDDPGLLERLLADRKAGRPAVVATTAKGESTLLHPGEDAPEGVDPEVFGAAVAASRANASQLLERDGGADVFLRVHNPPLRLIIVGGVHIAQVLARMARLADFEVTIIDPRAAFGNAERFPDVEVVSSWPDEAMEALSPNPLTAVVTLSHDAKLDEPALTAALRANPFYIGALGSGRTQKARRERLRAAGFDDEDLARIHGPVGLDIGARSAAEIAISIMAEIVQALHEP